MIYKAYVRNKPTHACLLISTLITNKEIQQLLLQLDVLAAINIPSRMIQHCNLNSLQHI